MDKTFKFAESELLGLQIHSSIVLFIFRTVVQGGRSTGNGRTQIIVEKYPFFSCLILSGLNCFENYYYT